MAFLRFITGKRVDEVIELNPSATLVLGSSADSHIQLTDDKEIHGTHCQVYPAEGSFWLRDLGEGGLTILNMRRLAGETDVLRDHDVFIIGRTFVKFLAERPAGGGGAGPAAAPAAQQEIESLRASQRGDTASDLGDQAREVAGIKVVSARVDGVSPPDLRDMIDALRGKLGQGVALLASEQKGSLAMAVGVTPDLTDRIQAGTLMRELAKLVGGKGGGRPDFAQGGGGDASRLEEAFAKLEELVESAVS